MTASRDVLVRVPQGRWLNWLAEGDLPDELTTGAWRFSISVTTPSGVVGGRCYVAAFGKVRGYAPIVARGDRAFVRENGAVAMTVPGHPFPKGQWSWMRATWNREGETPFPEWATEGLPDPIARDVRRLLELRRRHPEHRAELRARAIAGAMTAGELFRGMPA